MYSAFYTYITEKKKGDTEKGECKHETGQKNEIK